VRGFVPTPPEIVDHMVERLFRGRRPKRTDNLLDPGCGNGAFLRGVLRWCARNNVEPPRMVGVESEPRRVRMAQAAFDGIEGIEVRHSDFLIDPNEPFDFIVGNPPYVSIYSLSESEKQKFRTAYKTARGRFDLYLLFFERALKSLKPGGRMVFITPEKFLYVSTAAPLRRLLSSFQIEEIDLIDEESFDGFVTYPTVTTVTNLPDSKPTSVRLRDGTVRSCLLDCSGSSWMPIIHGARTEQSDRPLLKDICIRVSCGVATGADDIFVREMASLSEELVQFALPTISGRELTSLGRITSPLKYSMLVPYSRDGVLLPEHRLGSLGTYLCQSHVRKRLQRRTCTKRKPWYAFHETPPLLEMLRPKILCKDITQTPNFWIDETGTFVPRHSVYYIVPADAGIAKRLCTFLNSPGVAQWLTEHCQRAANGFLRLQSNVLKMLPIPDDLFGSRPRRVMAALQLELQAGLADSESTARR